VDAESNSDTLIALANRYTAERGMHFMPGVPSIVRMVMDQMRMDRRNGLQTEAFVSGYPGSPLGGLDMEFVRNGNLLADLGIVHQRGLNEELAATAIFGSQVASTAKGFRPHGVLGVWYGKSPGLDRAADALRHGNFAGTDTNGGVLVLVGDDPACKSSTLPSSCEVTCSALDMPVLHPANSQEILELGHHAVYMSRYSGLWIALKLVSAVCDGSSTVELDPYRQTYYVPASEPSGRTVASNLISPRTLELDREVAELRLARALEYANANSLNVSTPQRSGDWLGIVASGHTYLDVLSALDILGIKERELDKLGIRLLRLGMIHPLDRKLLSKFANGLQEILIVEERRPFIENEVRAALYRAEHRPIITGKEDTESRLLIPAWGALNADTIKGPLLQRLKTRIDASRLNLTSGDAVRRSISLSLAPRPAWFCSGCPHSNSTQVPTGSLVGTGIGCHGLASRMSVERVGTVFSNTQMGGEGAQWIGAAPFLETQHIFQNLGDGTLAHSGWLAIRFAVASGRNITYKILYNGATSMTGGQGVVGLQSIGDLIRGLKAEGVGRIIVTTDNLKSYKRRGLGRGVEVLDRRQTVRAQELLAQERGVTVLIHDQACAAEVRRLRNRGKLPPPPERVLINERVCEGCGDCGAKSTCLSLHTVETLYGRKTKIDSTSCNTDLSCLEGDCPSFQLVRPARRSHATSDTPDVAGAAIDISEPERPPVSEGFVVRMPGIGGTGVVTVSQVLALAANLDGLYTHGLDQTGLAQKAGPVVSDLRVTLTRESRPGRASNGTVDLFLAFDPLVSATHEYLSGVQPDHTMVVGSTTWIPTGDMIGNPEATPPAINSITEKISAMARSAKWVDAGGETTRLLGNATASNLLLVGVAYQSGAIPITGRSIEQAIRQNGVAVQANIEAFRYGRRLVVDQSTSVMTQRRQISSLLARTAWCDGLIQDLPDMPGLRDLVKQLGLDLISYQGRAYAKRYLSIVRDAALRGTPEFARAVASNLYKLMAYKDEYEVARLLTDKEARVRTEEVGGRGARTTFVLHPPLLRALGMRRKIRLGPWFGPLLRLIAHGRMLRGTPLDPFGYTHVRRVERHLLAEYIRVVQKLMELGPDTELALRIAELPQSIRGYEHVKLQSVELYEIRMSTLLKEFENAASHESNV
jgi:indolepyruvate ferredoxin oxidoreductase